MKRFEAVVLAIDMTNNALLPCQVMLLGHLLLYSLVCLRCLLIRLLPTARLLALLTRSTALILSFVHALATAAIN